MYYTQEQIDRANQADLVSFLQGRGEQLTRAGQEYRWKRHDSLTVRGNKWYRHSQSKGGAPIDFVMEFYGKSFTEAVEMLTGEKGAAPPPDKPITAPLSDFRLPPRSADNRIARNYLTAARRIDEDVSGFFFSTGDIYEEAAHHNAVFVGRDEDGVPRYAHQRGTAGSFRLDVKGSDKAFNFCYRGEGERLFVFEAPVDLLSFLCLFKKEWQKQSYLSLGGVGEKALLRFLSDRMNIKTVYLCLDNDNAGNDACSRLAELVPECLTVHRLVPLYKDWNEVLQHRAEIADGKYLREAVYGLKEPPQEETVEIAAGIHGSPCARPGRSACKALFHPGRGRAESGSCKEACAAAHKAHHQLWRVYAQNQHGAKHTGLRQQNSQAEQQLYTPPSFQYSRQLYTAPGWVECWHRSCKIEFWPEQPACRSAKAPGEGGCFQNQSWCQGQA